MRWRDWVGEWFVDLGLGLGLKSNLSLDVCCAFLLVGGCVVEEEV